MRGSLISVLCGVLLAVVVVAARDEESPAAAPPPIRHDYTGTTSDGSAATADRDDDTLTVSISLAAGSCSPYGTVPVGFTSVAYPDAGRYVGPLRYHGGRDRPIQFEGAQVTRNMDDTFAATVTDGEISGELTRVDTFAGRRCVRHVTFRTRGSAG